MPTEVSGSEQRVWAIDLGGTRVRVALAGADGRILSQASEGTLADEGPAAVLAQMRALARRILDTEGGERDGGPPPSAVGVAAPGPLDPRTGIVLDTPNLVGWKDYPIEAAVAEAFGAPAFAHNDANLAALGEARLGAGRGHELVVYLTVSTGVGGGIVRSGRIEAGANGLAGELGHVIVDAGGPRCNFGHPGCLEALASGTAIARAAREARAAQGGDDHGAMTAREVAIAAREGDPLAAAIMHRAARMLGLAVGGFINVLDPNIVIVGGGVSQSWDLLEAHVDKSAGEVVMAASRRSVPIVRAALGDDAGLVGAALWAAEAVRGAAGR